MNILKQTIENVRRQPLLSALMVLGTALSVCFILTALMTQEVKEADYGAEPNRSRTLYTKLFHVHYRLMDSWGGGVQPNIICDVFLRVKSAEAMALYYTEPVPVEAAAPGQNVEFIARQTVNADYFRVFRHSFLEGKPFTKEQCASNEPVAILSRSTCRKIFGQETGIVGKHLMLNNRDMRVAGVVEDVSRLTADASADVWTPYDAAFAVANPELADGNTHAVALMAKDRADFPKIIAETQQLERAYNTATKGDSIDLMGQPDPIEVSNARGWSFEEPDMAENYLTQALILAVLLIVPAINLASMTQSRLRHRRQEIGVRRAFGAKRSTILWQVVLESFLLTLVASIIGLLLCIAVCTFASDLIFNEGNMFGTEIRTVDFDVRVLLTPAIYGWTIFFALVLNLLSSLWPAWRACRVNIVEALK